MDSLILVVALGAALAGFVQGLSGFGFALVAMSVWAWLIDPQLAAALAVCGGLSGQILSAVTVRRGFDPKLLAPFVAGGLLGIPVGTLLLPLLDITLFKVVLGGLLVVLCPLMLAAPRLPQIRIASPLLARVVEPAEHHRQLFAKEQDREQLKLFQELVSAIAREREAPADSLVWRKPQPGPAPALQPPPAPPVAQEAIRPARGERPGFDAPAPAPETQQLLERVSVAALCGVHHCLVGCAHGASVVPRG